MYKEDVIEYYKIYCKKYESFKKVGKACFYRKDFYNKACQVLGVSKTKENINKIKNIINEEFGKPVINKSISERKELKAVELYKTGMPIKNIKELLGISHGSLYSILNKYNVERRGQKKKVNTECDLNREIVERVRRIAGIK